MASGWLPGLLEALVRISFLRKALTADPPSQPSSPWGGTHLPFGEVLVSDPILDSAYGLSGLQKGLQMDAKIDFRDVFFQCFFRGGFDSDFGSFLKGSKPEK